MGLKCGDLSHSAKVIELHEKWTNLVCEEFFNQGDIEKQRNLPVSMYCDRDTTDIPKSQAGFIKNICLPLFETWCSFLKSDIINQSCLENLKKNLRHWEDKSKSRRATAPGIKNVDIEELKRVSKYGTVEALVPKNLEN
jgi:3',5'-cyclic-nucleotide phosphodiesterase